MFVNTETSAKHTILEKEYQSEFCRFIQGQSEVVLDNKRRVDCVDSTYAVEVDFAHKVFEGIGQSEYYAYKTNKKAGLLLIVETDKDLNTIREFHDYLLTKGITYLMIYEQLGYFYIIKPEKIEDIPNTVEEKRGLRL
jgi:hypothetical protein